MSLLKYLPPLKYNSVTDADSYKDSHWQFYRPGTERVYSYLESRGGDNDTIMMAGVQPLLYKLGQPVEQWEVDEAEEFCAKHFGDRLLFNRDGWQSLIDNYGGKLPLKIKSLPEGLIVPKRTPLLSIENTVDGFAWLTSYKETMLLRDLWPACSIASRVFRMKQRIKPYFDRTSDNGVSPFALLDFSSRGTFGYSHSEIAGAAFNFMFKGSDNKPGIRYTNYYYDSDMAAFSVRATEHSIACGWGEGNDDDYIRYSLERTPVNAIVSLVGDTWDIFKFCQRLPTFKDIIANKNISPVARPDSGEVKPILKECLPILMRGFGSSKNSKGFDVMHYNAKSLWADGMNEETCVAPYSVAEELGISADCVMAGSGGGIAAKDLDRDTDRWAVKASEYVMADGTRLDIAKNPITDPGKISKSGRFGVIRHADGIFETIKRVNDHEDRQDLLEVRFLNGDVINPTNLEHIRERVEAQL